MRSTSSQSSVMGWQATGIVEDMCQAGCKAGGGKCRLCGLTAGIRWRLKTSQQGNDLATGGGRFKNLLFFTWIVINCLTKPCWFLPSIHMNQPQIYTCPVPLEPPFHLPPHPTPLGCHRALIWVPRIIQEFPPGWLFYRCCVSFFPC